MPDHWYWRRPDRYICVYTHSHTYIHTTLYAYTHTYTKLGTKSIVVQNIQWVGFLHRKQNEMRDSKADLVYRLSLWYPKVKERDSERKGERERENSMNNIDVFIFLIGSDNILITTSTVIQLKMDLCRLEHSKHQFP